jgi:hypothetical protein
MDAGDSGRRRNDRQPLTRLIHQSEPGYENQAGQLSMGRFHASAYINPDFRFITELGI